MHSPTLNLVVLRARDPAKLCSFYQALGLEFVTEKHGSGAVHHASRVGTSVFEIYPLRDDESPSVGARVGFSVPSLDTTLQTLAQVHGTIVSAPKSSPYGRRAVVSDPEGHKVELVEASS